MEKVPKKPALGVDRGGTTTRLALVDARGRVLRRTALPTVHIKRLPALVLRTAAAWKLPPDTPAVIATRGAMTRKWKKPFLLARLKGGLNLLDVISDAEAAVSSWIAENPAGERYLQTLSDVRVGRVFDLTTLPVAVREARNLLH